MTVRIFTRIVRFARRTKATSSGAWHLMRAGSRGECGKLVDAPLPRLGKPTVAVVEFSEPLLTVAAARLFVRLRQTEAARSVCRRCVFGGGADGVRRQAAGEFDFLARAIRRADSSLSLKSNATAPA